MISPSYAIYTLSDSSIAAKALDLLDTDFKDISSLKEIVIDFQMYPEEDLSDDLMKKLHDYGWIVKVPQLPIKSWISMDDRFEFDNAEDCQAYDDEHFLRDERRRRQGKEKEQVVGRTLRT